MLGNLLPGLREVRAPFAAGALWVLAAWIRWEPVVPSAADAKKVEGLAHSLYRLQEVVPPVALGAAAGLLVYVLGSLSVAVLSDPLKALFWVSVSRGDQRFNSLTPSAVEALYRVARETRKDVEASLAKIGVNVAEFLKDEQREVPSGTSRENRFVTRIETLWGRLGLVLRGKWIRARHRTMMGRHTAAPPPEAAIEHELVDLAIRDLDVVTTARLLGKDQELYSAIDRHRAEVEFRIGLIPPLIALFAATSFRVTGSGQMILLPFLAVTTSLGLYWDALKQQRAANGLLIDAAADGRVEFPSLERLRTSARSLVDMAPAEAEWRVETELARAIAILGKLDSFASSAAAASEAVDKTERRLHSFAGRLEPQVLEAAKRTLTAMRSAVTIWTDGVYGRREGAWVDEGREALEAAVEAFGRYRQGLSAQRSARA